MELVADLPIGLSRNGEAHQAARDRAFQPARLFIRRESAAPKHQEDGSAGDEREQNDRNHRVA